jgi:predicted  nucleic acid-binding Zn-ribbon protein
VTAVESIVRLHDVDLLLRESRDIESIARLRQMGFAPMRAAVAERTRERLLAELEPRWSAHYSRASSRYGRGLCAVRSRACQGCFMTLATSAQPQDGGSLTVCESCGRVLYWG